MHGQRPVAKRAVRAVFGAGNEFLHHPRIVFGDRQAARVSCRFLFAGKRQLGQVEPSDRIVANAFEDEPAGFAAEIIGRDLRRVRDANGFGRGKIEGGGGFGELVLIVQLPDYIRRDVESLAMGGQVRCGLGIEQAADGTGYRHEQVGFLLARQFCQGGSVSLILRLRHYDEAIDGGREPVRGHPVRGALGKDYAVPGIAERACELQRLGHFPATDNYSLAARSQRWFPPFARRACNHRHRCNPGRNRHRRAKRSERQHGLPDSAKARQYFRPAGSASRRHAAG